MGDLTTCERAVLTAIAGGPARWQSLAEVAAAVGRRVDPVADDVASLDAEGWVELRGIDGAGRLEVALSPLGAGRLKLVLDAQSARWRPAGEPARVRPKEPGRTISETDLRDDRPDAPWPLDSWVDPAAADPAKVAERAEAAGKAKPSRRDWSGTPPRPRILVGEGMRWDGPEMMLRLPCPACGGRRLGPLETCLLCDRWGLDRACGTTGRAQGPRRRYAPGRLKGGIGA